jgi:hypothetical protein
MFGDVYARLGSALRAAEGGRGGGGRRSDTHTQHIHSTVAGFSISGPHNSVVVNRTGLQPIFLYVISIHKIYTNI